METRTLSRRSFLGVAAASATTAAAGYRVRLPVGAVPTAALTGTRPVRFAVIADLHHGLAPDALDRLRTFVEAVTARADELDFVLQLGDFCHAGKDPAPCLDLWNTIKAPKLHVLGNHDMDTCTKAEAMRSWGMPARYGSQEFGGWRFITLDLNHIREGDARTDYANANFYIDSSKRTWADLEQLEWLKTQLESAKPTVVLSHQPLGLWKPGSDIPAQQQEVLDILLPDGEPAPGLATCLCGHNHVDRLEPYRGVPCWCVNSASYLWHGGMVPYARPLFAFVTLDPSGQMLIEGVEGAWAKPEDDLPELPDHPWVRPSIADRTETLAARP